MQARRRAPDRLSRGAILATLAYAAGLAWLSLARGGDWTCAGAYFVEHTGVSRADVLANVVAYVPFGAMVAYAFGRPGRRAPAALAALLAGSGLSIGVELLQACLPARSSSWIDVAANAGGTALGLLVVLPPWERWALQRSDGRPRFASLAPAPLGTMAIVAILMWMLQQTFPWLVTLDVGQVRQNLSFLAPVLRGELPIAPWRLARHAANWLVLGLLVGAAIRPWGPVLRMTLLLSCGVLAFQVIGGVTMLSLEQVVGWLVVLPLLAVLRLPVLRAGLPTLLMLATLAVTALYQLAPQPGRPTAPFSWLPVFGEGSVLGAVQLGLFFFMCALAYAVAVAWRAPSSAALMAGAAATVAWQAALEAAQLWVPGRVADTSSPLLVAVGWALAFAVLARARDRTGATGGRGQSSPGGPVRTGPPAVRGPASTRSRRSSP